MIVNVQRFSVTACILLALSVLTVAAPKAPAALPNFHQVGPGIYRGGAPTQAGLARLKAMGIHTIIDLRCEHKLAMQEKPRAEALGFTWVNLPMGAEPPTQQQVDTLLAALAKAPAETVFVHCQHGADRTGCMIGIYRVQVQGWSFADAWKEMRRYGFNPIWKKLTAAVRTRAKA